MKLASYTAIFVVLAWTGMTVAQVWWQVISGDLYWKITITMALLGGGIVAAALIAREYLEDKQLKKDRYID